MDRRLNRLERDYYEGRVDRREFLWRAMRIGGSFAFAANFLSACAPAAPASPTAAAKPAAEAAKPAAEAAKPAAPGAAPAASGGKPKKTTLSVTATSVLPTLDPHLHTSTDVSNIGLYVYGNLTMRDAKTKQVVPYLAT